MELIKLKDGIFLRVSVMEALELITSLSEQIRTNSPNANRVEQYTDKREYVSIAVKSRKNKDLT
ncbi:MAG TPA: hypothetical protein VM577_16965 [Anaerovoracaceae bacterium]|nr:hypothetical protein [Anaerovoracaceae bacterium]